MLLCLLGAVVTAMTVSLTFGVPVLSGTLVLLDFAAGGALAGAIVTAGIARVRRRALPMRTLLGTAACAALGLAHVTFAPAAPAVLLVVVDCLRADRLTGKHMPNTFELAASAVRFTQTRSQSSWTRSAMPSLLSGRYPIEHGLFRTRPPDRIHNDIPMVAERFSDAGWMTAGFVEQAQLDAAFGYGRGFGRYSWRDGAAGRLTESFLQWNRIFRSVPRFVLLHYIDVHGPYSARKNFRTVQRPKHGLTWRPWRATIKAVRRGNVVPTPDDWAYLSGLYDGEVRQIDHTLGQLYRTLQADGTLDASWFVFTADHGERFGEHGGAIEHMNIPDETVLSVPLVVRPPGGLSAPRVVTELVQHVDVVPTLLTATGLPPDPELPGRDLGPALSGEALEPAPSFAEEWYGKVHRVSVREGDWKLLRDPVRLHDLSSDPGERFDLAASHPDVVARLEGLLAGYFDAAARGVSIATVDWDAAARSGAVWTPTERRKAREVSPSNATIERLKALGYLEEGG